MTILHYSHTFFPVTGGKTTRLHNLLRGDGHTHELYVPLPALDVPPQERMGNINVHRVATGKGNGLAGRLPVVRRGMAARRMVAATEGVPAILYGHAPALSALAALRFWQRTAVPMLYEVHGIMHDSEVRHDAHGVAGVAELVNHVLISRLERKVLEAARVVIVQTRAVGDRIHALYGVDQARMRVVYNGVDPAQFDPERWAGARRGMRRTRGWDDVNVIFYGGFLDEINGARRLVDAFTALPAEVRRRGRLVIAGRGADAAYIEGKARASGGAITFLGSVPFDDMPVWYAASDTFVIPRPDTRPGQMFLPMKLLEAMAMTKTVVVSDVQAMREVVTDGETGLVYRNSEPHALEAVLARVLSDTTIAGAYGAAARAHVTQHFTWQTGREALRRAYADTFRAEEPETRA